jgi:ubiquinone/menaquinone biosynthesis C-methylase UbiE
LSCLGQNSANQVQRGSALELPYKSETFDYVYAIGCLHHTGNLSKAVSEVYRVLQPSGKAIVMLYHRYSFRRIVSVPVIRLRGIFSAHNQEEVERRIRALYDTNEGGEAAPHTDYVSRAEVKHLFNKFAHLRTAVQNFDSYRVFKGKITIPREILLGNLGRILGLDLYITATK